MKSFVNVAVVGLSGFVLVKFLAVPALGLIVGLVMLTAKIALVCAVGYFVWSMFFKSTDEVEIGAVDEKIEEVEVLVEE
jgi:hypothetical protein